MGEEKRPRWMHPGRGDASGEPVKVERFRASPRHGEVERTPESTEWRPRHPRWFSLHVQEPGED